MHHLKDMVFYGTSMENIESDEKAWKMGRRCVKAAHQPDVLSINYSFSHVLFIHFHNDLNTALKNMKAAFKHMNAALKHMNAASKQIKLRPAMPMASYRINCLCCL